MKRIALLALVLLCLLGYTAFAEPSFTIDDTHTYDYMLLPYAQGYSPQIIDNTAYFVLPLISDTCNGSITAELTPRSLSTIPIKLSNKFTQTVNLKTFTFSGAKIEAYKVYFKMQLHSSPLIGEYPCMIEISGKDSEGNQLDQGFPITLRVTKGRANDEVPDVGIEKFYTEDTLLVGNDATLHIEVANRSETREARNIVLTMTDATGDILPMGSDTISIGTLGAGDRELIDIPVNILSKAAAQPHAIRFTFTYTYAEGKINTKSENKTICIQQEVRLNHSEVALPTRVTQGESVSFNITLMNMGKGVLNNVLLTFDMPHVGTGGSVLAGSIEPGKSTQASTNLRVDGDFSGDDEGVLTITWEDGYGKAYEKNLPLFTTVIPRAAQSATISTLSKDVNDTTIKLRELIGWALAISLLFLFILKTILSNRRIRKLEEKQL